jgi:hypothetical protein
MLLRYYRRLIRISRSPVIVHDVIRLLSKLRLHSLFCMLTFESIRLWLIGGNCVYCQFLRLLPKALLGTKQCQTVSFWRRCVILIRFPILLIGISELWQLNSMNTHSSPTELFQVVFKICLSTLAPKLLLSHSFFIINCCKGSFSLL